MKLKVLGCSGGIGQNLRTSSFVVDEDILLDAGTGVGDLTLDEMRHIRHVFVTHSHMDHICSIPLLVDTLFSELSQPLMVYARAETLDALKTHVFNWSIWPDFSELPTRDSPVLQFNVMNPGDSIEIAGRRIEMVDVRHSVPASGYIISGDDSTLVYTGDTSSNETLWPRLNELSRIDFIVVECGFANYDIKLASLAKHYTPSLLASDLGTLKHRPRVGISHLKPGEESLIFQECRDALGDEWELAQLSSGDQFQI